MRLKRDVEEEFWGGGFGRWVPKDGEVAIGVLTVDDAGAWRGRNAEAESANGHAALITDFERGALAPQVGPPRASGRGAENGAVFLGGQLPSGPRSHAQFAVPFLRVAMAEEILKQSVGGRQFAEVLGGKEGRQTILPILVAAFDFAFGLWGGGIAERDAVEMEGRAELGERVRDAGEKDGVVVDIEFQRQAMREEGAREKVEVGEQIFAVREAGADAEPAAVIEHIEQWEALGTAGKEAVRSSIELPERADFGTLPAPHGSAWLAGRLGRGELMLQRKSADGGRIELEVKSAQHFARGKAIAGGRLSGEQLAEQGLHLGRPRSNMIPARTRRFPALGLACGTGAEVISVQLIEARPAQVQSLGGRGGC